jgi:hypothetical protein
MMKKLRIFLTALLLVPALTMNASAFTANANEPGLAPVQQSSAWCYFYYGGRWWLLPC